MSNALKLTDGWLRGAGQSDCTRLSFERNLQ